MAGVNGVTREAEASLGVPSDLWRLIWWGAAGCFVVFVVVATRDPTAYTIRSSHTIGLRHYLEKTSPEMHKRGLERIISELRVVRGLVNDNGRNAAIRVVLVSSVHPRFPRAVQTAGFRDTSGGGDLYHAASYPATTGPVRANWAIHDTRLSDNGEIG